MIKNELQYKRTQTIATEIEISLSLLESDPTFQQLEPLAQRAFRASQKKLLNQLQQELKEYEQLRGGQFEFSRLPDIDEIPRWLIQARIARGLGQEDLAKLLHLKKQQIQNYEATDYASASLSRILEIAHALTDLDERKSV